MKIKEINRGDGPALTFFCPGCGKLHNVTLTASQHPTGQTWQWNGDAETPTITPIRTYATCEFTMTDGVLYYTAACTHSLAGQTVPMVDL
jgi:hypothetical protein